MNIGDLVKIVNAPYGRKELTGTLAIIAELHGLNFWKDQIVSIHCLHDGGTIKTTSLGLELVEESG